VSEAELTAYFQEAASWDADRLARLKATARSAWVVATAGWVCAVAAALALALLVPLKRVDVVVVRVDSSTGVIDVVPPYDAHEGLGESVTRYFLTHYVTVCERFNFATAESDYEECGAFHGAQRNQAWYALWNSANPGSPLNVHKDGSSVRAQVQAVSFFRRASGTLDLAQVRYVRAERPGNGADERLTHWIATIQFAYTPPSQDPRVRRWNPLGFKVIEMTSEPEVQAAPVPARSG
jgi:type IV secretion system protein VirB8